MDWQEQRDEFVNFLRNADYNYTDEEIERLTDAWTLGRLAPRV